MRLCSVVATGALVLSLSCLTGCGATTVTGPSRDSADRGAAQPPPSTPPGSATCNAPKAQFAVGQPASSDLLERARMAAEAASARFLRPNQPITMEFSPSRLNLSLDPRDVVLGASCG
jgi:hypothetical protein